MPWPDAPGPHASGPLSPGECRPRPISGAAFRCSTCSTKRRSGGSRTRSTGSFRMSASPSAAIPRRHAHLARGGREHRRRRQGARAGRLDPRSLLPGAAAVHPVGAQSRPLGRYRRRQPGLRGGLRPALRARPRRRPALWRSREFPEPRETHLHAPAPPPWQLRGVRTVRYSGEHPPSRHAPRPHDVERQAAFRRHHRNEPGAGQRRHGRDRLRGRGDGRSVLHPRQRQYQLAPAGRQGRDRGDPGLLRAGGRASPWRLSSCRARWGRSRPPLPSPRPWPRR